MKGFQYVNASRISIALEAGEHLSLGHLDRGMLNNTLLQHCCTYTYTDFEGFVGSVTGVGTLDYRA